jgi:hypothetical protein
MKQERHQLDRPPFRIPRALPLALAGDGVLTDASAAGAIKLWQLDPAKPDPIQC